MITVPVVPRTVRLTTEHMPNFTFTFSGMGSLDVAEAAPGIAANAFLGYVNVAVEKLQAVEPVFLIQTEKGDEPFDKLQPDHVNAVDFDVWYDLGKQLVNRTYLKDHERGKSSSPSMSDSAATTDT